VFVCVCMCLSEFASVRVFLPLLACVGVLVCVCVCLNAYNCDRVSLCVCVRVFACV